jgi:hypothetical protein
MPGVRFEHATPVFKRMKTIHALRHTATVIGFTPVSLEHILNNFQKNYYTGSFFLVISQTNQ